MPSAPRYKYNKFRLKELLCVRVTAPVQVRTVFYVGSWAGVCVLTMDHGIVGGV